jgi:hypothetical protein
MDRTDRSRTVSSSGASLHATPLSTPTPRVVDPAAPRSALDCERRCYVEARVQQASAQLAAIADSLNSFGLDDMVRLAARVFGAARPRTRS